MKVEERGPMCFALLHITGEYMSDHLLYEGERKSEPKRTLREMILQSKGSCTIISQVYNPNITRRSFWNTPIAYQRHPPSDTARLEKIDEGRREKQRCDSVNKGTKKNNKTRLHPWLSRGDRTSQA